MADIKAGKLQPEPTDMAEGYYAEKVVLSQHNLELERALQNHVPDSAEEKALVRKLDLYMGPTLWFMYILAYIDRQNIGNAKVAGMEADLQLDDSREHGETPTTTHKAKTDRDLASPSAEYAMLLSIFFIGYLVCEVPSKHAAHAVTAVVVLPARHHDRLGHRRTVCAIMSVVKNYEGMLALRFFLGCMEAGFFPGVLYVMTCWYKKAEIGQYPQSAAGWLMGAKPPPVSCLSTSAPLPPLRVEG